MGRQPAPDVVIADYDSGLGLLACGGLGRRVLILTHSDSEAMICHALEQGARGYLLMGCSLQDLVEAVRSVYTGGIALGPLVASRIADRMKQQALTRREGEILRYMMLGMSNKAIASKLILAVGTVKTHVKSVLEKLEADEPHAGGFYRAAARHSAGGGRAGLPGEQVGRCGLGIALNQAAI